MHILLFLNIGTQEMILLAVFAIAGLAPLIFAVLALIDIFKRDFAQKSTDRILLILLVLLLPIFGSIIYFVGLRDSYPLNRKVV
ncbi:MULTISPECIES: PLDc N-terminal domain-containing protein [Sphingobacterium]|uniref:PLDc N-terminal domain-containing protein n=1 Tax=Sphingobacterium TaxID=28453 RepID=UPI0013DBB32A|nr:MULTISPECIES: PLDc N-terminal domain-containing protein [unclassified Sphingobacterium]